MAESVSVGYYLFIWAVFAALALVASVLLAWTLPCFQICFRCAEPQRNSMRAAPVCHIVPFPWRDVGWCCHTCFGQYGCLWGWLPCMRAKRREEGPPNNDGVEMQPLGGGGGNAGIQEDIEAGNVVPSGSGASNGVPRRESVVNEGAALLSSLHRTSRQSGSRRSSV